MRIDSKQYIRLVQKHYDQYVLGNEPFPDNVPTGMRQEIFRSWQRSKSTRVDPVSDDGFAIPSEELNQSLDAMEPFMGIAKPYLNNIYSFIRGSNFLLHITDSSGRLLKYYADDALISNLFTVTSQLQIGSKRNEAISGTDSTSLCLKLDKAVQVIGPEHYLQRNHRFFCSSAPIHDINDETIAVLTIMGPVELYQNHTLGMAYSAAGSIELALRNQDYIHNLQHNNELLKFTLNSLDSAILVTDENHRVLNVNDSFLKIFLFTKADCIGKRIPEVFDPDSIPEQFRRADRDLDNVQCTLRTIYGFSFNVVVSLKVVSNPKEGITMRYYSFTEQKKINRLVNQMTRSSAVFTFDSIIGTSRRITQVKELAAGISNSFSNILILGESGTGKELFAQSIHNASNRCNEPFIALNCSSIPKDLIESELFGYVNGAFTGARKEGQPGKFELANQGTLFLDEIGDMPLELQSSLLRVLQTHELTRLGSSKPIKLDVRIIAATNRNLEYAISHGTFRKDLYYRLNVLSLTLPPLRERVEDIPSLIYSFMDRFSRSLNKGSCTITNDAIAILCRYDWPGNIRQLENVIERAINIIEGSEITTEHIPEDILEAVNGSRAGYAAPAFASSDAGRPYPPENGTALSPAVREHDIIIELLEQENGHVASVAERMGIPASTLYRKLRKHQIRAKDYKRW